MCSKCRNTWLMHYILCTWAACAIINIPKNFIKNNTCIYLHICARQLLNEILINQLHKHACQSIFATKSSKCGSRYGYKSYCNDHYSQVPLITSTGILIDIIKMLPIVIVVKCNCITLATVNNGGIM